MHKVFAHTTDPRNMIGMTDVEAAKVRVWGGVGIANSSNGCV